MKEINVYTKVSIAALDLVEGDYYGVVQLIKELDAEMHDWHATLELYEYFAAQKAIYDKESGLT